MNTKSLTLILQALSSEKRLTIFCWLLNPLENFPPQQDGDLIDDGVCVGFITDKIGLKQPTVTSHMKIMVTAGLVSQKKIKNWVFYKPNRNTISLFVKELSNCLSEK